MPTPTVELFREECFSLSQAARRLPQLRGKGHPHPSTVRRWATEGRKSIGGTIIRLETAKVGGTRCTSAEAIARFLARLNDPAPTEALARNANNRMDKEAEEATRILRQRGLIKSGSGRASKRVAGH